MNTHKIRLETRLLNLFEEERKTNKELWKKEFAELTGMIELLIQEIRKNG
jgi:hypothetical protein